jgi:hypothetical protein
VYVQVGSEFAVGPLEQQRQLEALRVLDAVLAGLANEEGMGFAGLNFHVYHPDACPLGGFGLHHDGDAFGLGAGHIMRSHVADDGCLHVVADRVGLRESLMAMDLDRARVLTKVCAVLCWWGQTAAAGAAEVAGDGQQETFACRAVGCWGRGGRVCGGSKQGE